MRIRFFSCVMTVAVIALTAAVARGQSLQSYSKFDFIPGEQVIFFDDFSSDEVGDFPMLWNTNHSGEIVTTNIHPGKWFRLPAEGGNIFLEPIGDFPDNVTIEFDMIAMAAEEDAWGNIVVTYYAEPEGFDLNVYGVPGKAGVEVSLGVDRHLYANYAEEEYIMESSNEKAPLGTRKKRHISIWVQKSRFRIYVDEQKVFDLPKGLPAGYTYNRFRFNSTNTDFDALIGNFRIAAGAPDTRSKLLTEGVLVTRGILFDSGSDKIRPESYGALKDISTVLQENPDVRVMIVGHTDSDGDEAMNLDLSKRRAASVKQSLSQEFGIDGGRMETDGKGESEPVEDNSTAAGKANNRRVVFIKL